ncbi:hypothetical protein BBJ28_00025196, partial [Nothophytophthora sp. Chile5]
VHRVLITSVVLAAKFFDDHYFNNAYYAKVGGVPCAEMNELEVEYLLLLNFSLHVSSETYARYYNELANHYMFSSALPPSPYYQLRHFVAPDPSQQGALVYVTESFPTAPQPSGPLAMPPLRRTAEDGGDATPGNGIACTKSSQRASGQKRRSAVALGVNA